MTARSNSYDTEQGVAAIATLFGILYFVQGISEPTEGLIAQPTRSLLRNWGHSAESVGRFMAILALPWAIKPLYGLLTDFVPILGTRRRSWLLITTMVTSASLIAVFAFGVPRGAAGLLLIWLLVPTVGVAFSDVVVDALMVEEGQPRGLTGRLQSVQWTTMWAATILTGVLGGVLSERNLQEVGFLIAGLATAVSFAVAFFIVREPTRTGAGSKPADQPPATSRDALASMMRTFRQPGILTIGIFLFLWNFNPFTASLLEMHMVRHLGFSEQFAGYTLSIQAFGSLLASLAYGFYCRHLNFGTLVHLSIATGVLATMAYWGLAGTRSAVAISFVVGFVYMTGTIIQLDLAAQLCELETAGTTFALLMALTNLSVSMSIYLGGWLYDRLAADRHFTFAFETVVAIGALSTCCCWLLMPWIRRYCIPKDAKAKG
jgi:predicted MFS family arabinose efflux permease